MTLALIKMTSAPLASVEEAHDQLAGIRVIPGFVFGYVLTQKPRVVSFHRDADPAVPLQPGQDRLVCALPPIGRPEHYLTEERQQELIALAPTYPANAVRLAVTETVEAIVRGSPTNATSAPELQS